MGESGFYSCSNGHNAVDRSEKVGLCESKKNRVVCEDGSVYEGDPVTDMRRIDGRCRRHCLERIQKADGTRGFKWRPMCNILGKRTIAKEVRMRNGGASVRSDHEKTRRLWKVRETYGSKKRLKFRFPLICSENMSPEHASCIGLDAWHCLLKHSYGREHGVLYLLNGLPSDNRPCNEGPNGCSDDEVKALTNGPSATDFQSPEHFQ
jgi:hypothetical protein